MTAGTPWTWGENSYGQLGNGTTTTRRTPGAVPGLSGVIDLHGGREHVAALKSDGTVWTWGSNQEGQLGIGGTTNSPVPVRVTGLTGTFIAVETGHNHTLALRNDGTVWSFGLNSDGQLGDGTTTTRRTPVRVMGITDAIAIAAGRDMSYAIRADHTVLAWGRNTDGQIGDGTLTRRLTPVAVKGLANVVHVAGGRDHGLAVETDGSVWAWGDNAYYQVGDGTTTDRSTPVRVITSGAADVAAGAHHSLALLTSGAASSWGRDYRAELGDGNTSTASRPRPGPVVGVTSAVSIGAGRDTGMVTTSDGRVQMWGHNLYGQLGDGTTTNHTSAFFVPGITNAVKAAGGGSAYSVALVGDTGPPPNQPPTAKATFSCTLLDCGFVGSGSTDIDGNVVGYLWDFGDGKSSTEADPQHTYDAAGTYPVKLTVTDDDNATDDDTVSVTVTATPPPNQPPVADARVQCSALSCTFDGTHSSDIDGTVDTYAWDFGDNSTSGLASTTHPYAVGGTYDWSLTVTDNDGDSDTATGQVTVSEQAATPPTFRAGVSSDANTTSASVIVPSSVQAGDVMVLVASTNTAATHTTPAGWTLVTPSVVDGTNLRSSVFTRTADGSSAGSTVRVAISALSKTDLMLLAYSSASPVTVAASAVQGSTSVTSHPAPATTVAQDHSTVVRYWVDKSSTTRSWTVPAGVTQRLARSGSGGGLLAAVSGDTTDVAAGPVPAVNATSTVASDKAIAWTIVIP